MMSLKVTGIRELSKKMNRLRKGIPKTGEKSIRRAMKFGKRQLKAFAPYDSGDLKAGIRRKTFTKKGNVIGILSSTVPGAYPYNLWINETSPFKYSTLARRRTKSGKWPTKAIRARWPRIYTRRWLYRNTNRTGVAGYFDKTIKIMEKKYPSIAFNEIKKTIRRSGFK